MNLASISWWQRTAPLAGALVACAVILVETAQSRLRFYRYQEPLAAAFLLAVLAIVANQIR